MNKYKILVLDDDHSVLLAIKSLLEIEGYEIYCAENIKEAEKIIESVKIDFYILDVYLKDENGIKFLEKIRKYYKIDEPVIILTGIPSEEIFMEGFKKESDFFLQKNKAIPDIIYVVKRLLEQKKTIKNNFDKVENLSIRTIPYLIELIKKNKNLDRILVKVDAYPLFSYQEILSENFSQILEEMLFHFLYNLYEKIPPKIIEAQVTESCADLIISLICPINEENQIREKAKIATIKTIKFMRNKIKDSFYFFDVKIIPFKVKNKDIRLELYHSLQMKGKFEPIPLNSLNYDYFYQGIFETNTKNLKGYEIFARPEGFENVEMFYKKLEKLHLHGHIDGFNIEKMSKLISYFPSSFFININISPKSLLINKFSRNLVDKLGYFQRNIYIEFTERTPYLTNKIVKEKISFLKKNGFLIAIDDVGAGYNNISAILSIEPDLIKIDKVLVKGISNDEYKKSAFISILELSKKMGSLICAEGVEKESDFQTLKEINPDFIQGYYLHYPENISQRFLKRKVG